MKAKQRKQWSEDEDRILLSLLSKRKGVKEIKNDIPGRNLYMIYGRKKRLQFPPTKMKWTPKENKLILDNFSKGYEELVKIF